MPETDAYLIIARRQLAMTAPAQAIPPEHRPQMLYFGCIDARLDPISDIGIEKGKLLIFRNVAALVPPYELEDGRPVGQALSAGAAIEFFLEGIPPVPGLSKHIVVSGHTDCGGLKACRDGTDTHSHHLPLYLESLKQVRGEILAKARSEGWNGDRTLHALEEASVRQSVANLLTYPTVKEALWKKAVRIHGWILNTATCGISEMNLKTGHFAPMSYT